LNGHRQDKQIGVVERAWTDGKRGHATIRFSKNEEADKIFQDVIDKIVRNISVGYNVNEYSETSAGEAVIPTYTAIDWEPAEISTVSVPADYRAGVRSGNEENETPVKISKLNTRQMENEVTPAATPTPTTSATPTPTPTPEKTPAPVVESSENVRSAAIEAERKRSADIISAVRSANLPNEFAEKLISNGTAIDQARALIIAEFAKNDPHKGNANVQVTGVDETEKLRNAQEAALVLRAQPSLESKKIFDAAVVEAARAHRGKTLLDFAKESLIRAGVKIEGMDKMEIVKRAFTTSTSDFPILLSGVNRQILLASYSAVADTWRQFCKIGSVSDFREHRRLRMGTLSNLDKVNENGEIKNKPLTDADYEKTSIGTKGNIINVTRKMVINDDLNGLAQLATMLGRAAARSIESDVYALFALNSGNGPTMVDGNPLFHASHGNIATTGGAPSVALFDEIRQIMKKMKDKDGNDFLDIMPAIWLGPTSLGGAAKVVNEAQYDVDLSNKFQVPNKSRGMFSKMIDTPRLSGTPWYALANPEEEPVFEVSFLDGNQTPYLESEQGFEIDGMRWKIRHDYGVGAIGFKGIVKNAGA